MSTVTMAVGGLAAAIIAVLVLRAAPRIMVTLWLVVLFFVPIWVGVTVGPFWSAITLVTILAIATCSKAGRLYPTDGLMAGFGLLILAQFTLGLTTLPAAVIALSEWLIPYIWGRIILTRVRIEFLVRAMASLAVITALLALFEAATGTNLFIRLPPGSQSAYTIWATLQPRGGFVRVEGAFGHSIALGATLSMCAAFLLAAKWRLTTRLAMLLIVAGGIVFTLSRIGLVTLALTVVLSVAVLPELSRRARVLLSVASVAGALIIMPFISGVLLKAGQEAGGSADYRFDLLAVASVLRPFGAAPDIAGLTVGGTYLGVFAKSIDNAILVVAMRVGWVPAVLLVAAILAAILPLFKRGRANVANIAVAGQLPGLFAVAFITQYATFFWFVVGLAVALGSGQKYLADPVGELAEPERSTAEKSYAGKLNRLDNKGVASS